MNSELLALVRRLRRRVEQSPPAFRSRSAEGCEALARQIDSCRRCPLGETRRRAVVGVGSPRARVLFVGEGPGFEEDRRGEPFVGRAGELLDRILAAIGLSRRTVYITNVVKCRPMKDPRTPEARGNDRPPTEAEIAACRPYLDEQIRAVAPKIIVALGAVSARILLGSEDPIGRLRGAWREYRQGDFSAKLMATYHPAALLRDPELKKDVWKDMKAVKAELDRAV